MNLPRNILLAAISCIALLGLSGCNLRNTLKHTKSDIFGLDRKITLYSNTGTIIKEWRTRAKIEDHGGTVYFIADGKAVTISGTFIVEEQ